MSHIILLHGALGSSDQMRGLGDILRYKGKEIHYLDFNGHGKDRSSNEGFGIPFFASQLFSFIQNKKISKPAVFGYSMGGYVALRMESEHPGTLSSVMTLGTKFKWNPEIAANEMKNLDPTRIENKVPKFAAMLEKMHGADWKDLLSRTAQMMKRMGEKDELSGQELSKIRIPVLISLAENDQMVTREETESTLKALPNADGIHYFKGKHPIETVDTEEIANRLLEFTP